LVNGQLINRVTVCKDDTYELKEFVSELELLSLALYIQDRVPKQEYYQAQFFILVLESFPLEQRDDRTSLLREVLIDCDDSTE
jgi:hypothetical protein